jgi:autotransporter-associated beta strand protein
MAPNAATNLVFGGGTLQYTGLTASTSRLFTLTNGGGTIDASGTGAVTFSNPGSVAFSGTGARTLTLTGSSIAANTLSPILGDGTGGATSLGKTGAGTWNMTGANTYTGGTTVSGGTLRVGNASGTSATGTGAVNVTGTGAVGSGGTLGGNGFITGTVTISSATAANQGGTIAPGNSIGTITVGNMVWQPNGTYVVEHDPNSSATPGTTNDLISSPGTLDLSGLVGGPFTISLVPTVPGPTPSVQQAYTIVNAAGGIILPAGQNPSNLNNLFNFTGAFNSAPVASLNGNALQLTFTPVPEPAFVLLGCGAVAGAAGWWKRRRATAEV